MDAATARTNLGLGDISPLNAGTGLTINGSDLDADVASLVGEVKMWPTNTSPTLWLELDGALISRTTYSALFAVIGTTYGVGDGSTTFGLPDTRGEFVRGWDNTRGVDSGRAIGTSQGEDTAPHTHSSGTLVNSTDGAHTHDISIFSGGQTSVSASESQTGLLGTTPTSSAGAHTHTISGATGSTGTTETRPRNLALMYIMFAGV